MKKLSLLATTAVLASTLVGVTPANAAQFVRENIMIDFYSGVTSENGPEEGSDSGYILNGKEWSNYGLDISVETTKNGTGDRNVDDSKRLTLYDTTSTGGRDDDLETGSQWGTEKLPTEKLPTGSITENNAENTLTNALIIQETWEGNNWETNSNGTHYLNPDDDRKGGTIIFDFLSADIDYIYEDLNIGLLDIDYHAGQAEKAHVTIYYTDHEGNQYQDTKTLNTANHTTNPDVTLLSKERGDNSLWNFHFDVEEELKGLLSLDRVEVEYTGSGAVAYLEYDRYYKESYGEVEVPEPGSVMALLALGSFGGYSVLKHKKS